MFFIYRVSENLTLCSGITHKSTAISCGSETIADVLKQGGNTTPMIWLIDDLCLASHRS
jgi:hypothetical protein